MGWWGACAWHGHGSCGWDDGDGGGVGGECGGWRGSDVMSMVGGDEGGRDVGGAAGGGRARMDNGLED